jgi:sugar/nucleoside kinase (ribokinase family)
LDFPEDRVILANYSKSQHKFDPKNKDYDYVFLTSIPEEWENAYGKILEFAKTNNIPLAFSPGTRQLEEKSELVLEVLKHTKIYFSNRDEAQKIIGQPPTAKPQPPKDLLLALKQMGPEIVSITDGGNGAYAIDGSNTCYSISPSPSDGTERTGAGDAYMAAFFAAILEGKDVSEAMRWGTLNSGGVMQHVGAQTGLLTKKQLDKELQENNNLKAESI